MPPLFFHIPENNVRASKLGTLALQLNIELLCGIVACFNLLLLGNNHSRFYLMCLRFRHLFDAFPCLAGS